MTEVLIVGAGPAGLTLAIELQRRNISHRLIDAAPVGFQGSRGKGIQPRTQEIFDDLGVIDRVLAECGPYPKFRTHLGPFSIRAGRLGGVTAATDDVPYPNLQMLPQWKTDALLTARLEELGGRVERSTSLTRFEQSGSGVTATLKAPHGEEQLTARYLAGCDGGHSAVRKALAVGFEGSQLEIAPILIADLQLEGLDAKSWHVWPMAKGGVVTLCPLPNTKWFQLSAPLNKSAPAPEATEAGVRGFLMTALGSRAPRIMKTGWISLFRPSLRMASSFRIGRVFLAGDAAHVHPPTGGQGLNTAVQDAYNLGWKLAARINGAPDALLDTYEAERLPIAASVLGLSHQILKDRSVKRGANTKQLQLSYRGGPLSTELRSTPTKVQAGDRAPNAKVGTSTLFDEFRGTHFTLLSFDMTDVPTLPNVKTVHVTEPRAREAYGVKQPTWLLVRPDGYVGLATRAGDVTTLTAYLNGARGTAVGRERRAARAS